MTRDEYLVALHDLKEKFMQTNKPKFEVGQAVKLIGVCMPSSKSKCKWIIAKIHDVAPNGYYEYKVTNVNDKLDCYYITENNIIAE